MGRGGKAGKRGSGAATNLSELREAPVPGAIPRFEIPNWQEKFGVVAGITGRDFDLGLWSKQPVGEVMSRWLAFRRSMSGFQAIALGNQVHGVELMTAGASPGWTQVEGIDGWITTTPGTLLTVTVADCVPLYLVAPGRGVALLHAGWRGTAGGIIARGVERLAAETGCTAGEIVMHCGVGICGDCYEVGSEVMLGCGVPAEGSGPWHIDLRERLVAQAVELGLAFITRSSWCSAHDRSLFYSHRASGGVDGRMVGYLGLSSA
jgi:purine-nucleoside/S-methyl-5'-thioadenosine phosphorylase / adenosine deaminase